MSADHNTVLRDAARRILGPLGLVQKGRSRTWLDDHGWWLLVVEFQPSGFGRGSYLNVGPMHLWANRDYFCFENEARVTWGRGAQFVEARGDATPAFEALVQRAADRVAELRAEHGEGLPALRRLARLAPPYGREDIWNLLNAGIAAGLAGEVDWAESRFDRLIQLTIDSDADWEQALADDVAARWRAAVRDPTRFRAEAEVAVARTRELLKLPPAEPLTFP